MLDLSYVRYGLYLYPRNKDGIASFFDISISNFRFTKR